MFKIFKLVPSLIVVGILIGVIYFFIFIKDYELKELASLPIFLQFVIGYTIVSLVGFVLVALDIGKDTNKETRKEILKIKKNHKPINGRHSFKFSKKSTEIFYANVDEITFFDKLFFEHGRPLDIDNLSEFEHGVVYYFFLIQWMGLCTIGALVAIVGIPFIIIVVIMSMLIKIF